MRVILVGLVFTLCSLGQAEFNKLTLDSIVKLKNGDAEINLSYIDDLKDGKKQTITLRDDDGIATLAIVHFMVTQKASDDTFRNNKKWEDVKGNVVDGMSHQVRKTIVESAIRGRTWYFERAKQAKTDEEKKAREAIGLELGRLSLDFSAKGPWNYTYERQNLLGRWLDANARRHGYDGVRLLENAASNPLGAALISRRFTLPTTMAAATSFSISGDLDTILERLNAPPVEENRRKPRSEERHH